MDMFFQKIGVRSCTWGILIKKTLKSFLILEVLLGFAVQIRLVKRFLSDSYSAIRSNRKKISVKKLCCLLSNFQKKKRVESERFLNVSSN